jgi:hypothetical protein
MGVVSIPKRNSGVKANWKASHAEPVDWVNIAAGSALLVSGLLFLTERRRAGIAVAAAGTALALLDQQEAVRTWWNRIPDYVDHVQNLIGQVQEKVDEFTAKRESLQRAFSGTAYEEDYLRVDD